MYKFYSLKSKNKKNILISVAAAVIIVLIAAGIFLFISNTRKAPESADTFGYNALKLNGQYVSQDIFLEERNNFFLKWSKNAEMLQKTDEERNDLLLDEIIKRVVVEYYINDKAQITIPPKDVNEYIDKYINTRYANMGGVESYMEGSGFETEDDMKKNVEFYLKKVKYFSKIAAEYGVTISDSDLEKEYQKQKIENTQVTGKRIHISSSTKSSQEALKLANDLYGRLKKGEDFAELAKEYSDDEESKDIGGTMNSITGGIYSEDFDKAVFNATPGQLLPPVSNMGGYDIVYVEKFIYFYHPKDELKDMLLTQNFGESDKFNQWLDKAKSSVSIEITDPALKAFRLFKNKQYNDAGDCYKEAFDKTKVQLYLDRAAESYKSAENWDKVIDTNKLGMKKFSAQVSYYIGSAEAYYKKKNMDEAVKLMKKAESLSKDSIVFKQQVADMYSQIGLDKDSERVKKEIAGSTN